MCLYCQFQKFFKNLGKLKQKIIKLNKRDSNRGKASARINKIGLGYDLCRIILRLGWAFPRIILFLFFTLWCLWMWKAYGCIYKERKREGERGERWLDESTMKKVVSAGKWDLPDTHEASDFVLLVSVSREIVGVIP